VLSEALCHQNVLVSGGANPRILYFWRGIEVSGQLLA